MRKLRYTLKIKALNGKIQFHGFNEGSVNPLKKPKLSNDKNFDILKTSWRSYDALSRIERPKVDEDVPTFLSLCEQVFYDANYINATESG